MAKSWHHPLPKKDPPTPPEIILNGPLEKLSVMAGKTDPTFEVSWEKNVCDYHKWALTDPLYGTPLLLCKKQLIVVRFVIEQGRGRNWKLFRLPELTKLVSLPTELHQKPLLCQSKRQFLTQYYASNFLLEYCDGSRLLLHATSF